MATRTRRYQNQRYGEAQVDTFVVQAAAARLHAPAADTAAVVTLAAPAAGVCNVIEDIWWSYSAAPTGGNLIIEDGSGTTVFSVDVSASGAGYIHFAKPLKFTAATATVVTLAAAGNGVSGKVNVPITYTEAN